MEMTKNRNIIQGGLQRDGGLPDRHPHRNPVLHPATGTGKNLEGDSRVKKMTITKNLLLVAVALAMSLTAMADLASGIGFNRMFRRTLDDYHLFLLNSGHFLPTYWFVCGSVVAGLFVVILACVRRRNSVLRVLHGLAYSLFLMCILFFCLPDWRRHWIVFVEAVGGVMIFIGLSHATVFDDQGQRAGCLITFLIAFCMWAFFGALGGGGSAVIWFDTSSNRAAYRKFYSCKKCGELTTVIYLHRIGRRMCPKCDGRKCPKCGNLCYSDIQGEQGKEKKSIFSCENCRYSWWE